MPRGLTAAVGRWTITEWVAVLDTAGEPAELGREVEALVELCPDRVLLEHVDCHQGLADALKVPPGTWVCGLAAGTRPELDEAVGRIRASPAFGDRPLVEGQFRLLRLADWDVGTRC